MRTWGLSLDALRALVRRGGVLTAVVEGSRPGTLHFAVPGLTEADRHELQNYWRPVGVEFVIHDGVDAYLAHLRRRTDALAARCGL